MDNNNRAGAWKEDYRHACEANTFEERCELMSVCSQKAKLQAF